MPTFRFLGLELGCLFAPIFRFLGLELGCVNCAYFPLSRFGIRLCSFVPIFHFLGLELGCCLRLFSVFSVWN